ncbi:hypothetical protein KIN20_028020 [Parelaphostrongylus tenuis]|uniref:Mos1 transposase HTH domain-containing protein n=1 Tax=Parelaphostrongylus tenuis TaxID=148309 RepID=A0AAD5WEM4_PARTN|nr:hypothetical protein KIN20_028019 [Parelaphostrongylus tenuis]KAJ1367164.1 hypothetical protein KIN20_028020 [Parelaphostrongylus tenuis]
MHQILIIEYQLITMDKIELRVVVRYCCKRQLSTRDAAKKICGAEGEETVNRVTVAKLHKRFESVNLTPEDHARWHRLLKWDDEDLQTALMQNR